MADSSSYHLLQGSNDEEKIFTKSQIKGLKLSFYLHMIVLILLYITVVFAGALTVVIFEQSPDSIKKNSHPQIYKSMHTHIPSSEAARLSVPTLPVPNRENHDQYLIQLEVYHQLHCLNTIRQAIWLDGVPRYRSPHFGDFYRDDGSRNYAGHGAKHIDHCLDWIRQSLLCNADTTPISWAVDTVAHQPLPQLPEKKTCKNIKVIDQWTRENAVDGSVDFGYGPDNDL